MSNEAGDGGPRLSAILGAIATIVTFVAIVTEGVSYVAARDYLLPFGLDPVSIGITPLNAALRMTSTAMQAFFGSTLALIPILLLLLISNSAKSFKMLTDSRKQLATQTEELSASVRSTSVPPYIERLGIDLSAHLAIRRRAEVERDEKRALYTLSDFMQWADTNFRPLLYVFAAVICVLVLGFVFLNVSDDALTAGGNLRDHPLQDINPTTVSQDLQPLLVTVEWNDSTKVPLVLTLAKPIGPILRAYLMGEEDGQFCFYFFDEHEILFVPDADVAVGTPVVH